MANLSIFSKDIRNMDGLFSLNDLHKAAGTKNKHRPSLFIRTEQTQELISEITQGTDMCFALKTNHGGTSQGTWVCKELVYAYAMWISAKFHLAVIRAFDQLSVAPNQSPIGKKDHECLAGLIDGKTSHLKGEQRTSAKARLWAQLRKAYSVDAAADITANELDSARQFVGRVMCWKGITCQRERWSRRSCRWRMSYLPLSVCHQSLIAVIVVYCQNRCSIVAGGWIYCGQ